MGDYRTTTGEPHPIGRSDRVRQRRKWARRGLTAFTVLLLAGFLVPVRVRVPANGYVTSDVYAEVRPSVAGRVREILGQTGDRVQEGDLLVQLEDAEERAYLRSAESAVRSMQAQLVRREAELALEARQLQHQVSQAQLRLAHAEQEWVMTQELETRGLASGLILEEKRTAVALSRSALESILDQDATLAEKEIAVLHGELEVRRSEVARAEARLATRQVRAPVSGEVVRYEFVPGELVMPEHVLYEVFGGERQVLKLRVPERYATRVVPGSLYKARLRADAGTGNRWIYGEVEALRSVIQSDGPQAYRMAYCRFDAGGRDVPPGASAEARITVARVPFWLWITGIR